MRSFCGYVPIFTEPILKICSLRYVYYRFLVLAVYIGTWP